MGMDEEWKKAYDVRAFRDIPEHMKVCWSNEGYEQLKRLTVLFASEFRHTPKLLDVGCGVGTYCQLLHERGFDTLGVDYSEPMVQAAQKQYPNLKFQTANGYDLPFSEKEFDVVVSIGALQCLEHYKLFIEQICRVAKNAVILSTLLADHQRNLEYELTKLLVDDSWPTREYHPLDLVPIFEEAGFSCEVITTENGEPIIDGYFIIARRL
jgi:2-polyprenyl-3-methyl-5-hydroxy-6-metoxy-1,4-benzoquinol methylase